MDYIILKRIISKKDKKIYYILGIPTGKKNIGYIWKFISLNLYRYYITLYDIEKSIEKDCNVVLFLHLKELLRYER